MRSERKKIMSTQANPHPQASSSLYHRLGGYDVLAVVVDKFFERLGTDPQLARFGSGFSLDSQRRLRQLTLDFLAEATGGPCFYLGRSMKAAHAGLGITEQDWVATVNHLMAAFDHGQVPQKEKEEVLAWVGTLKGEIVEK
jgi:hemoglobin